MNLSTPLLQRWRRLIWSKDPIGEVGGFDLSSQRSGLRSGQSEIWDSIWAASLYCSHGHLGFFMLDYVVLSVALSWVSSFLVVSWGVREEGRRRREKRGEETDPRERKRSRRRRRARKDRRLGLKYDGSSFVRAWLKKTSEPTRTEPQRSELEP